MYLAAVAQPAPQPKTTTLGRADPVEIAGIANKDVEARAKDTKERLDRLFIVSSLYYFFKCNRIIIFLKIKLNQVFIVSLYIFD